MTTVSDLLKRKRFGVWSVKPNVTVYQALGLMSDKNIGAVVVLEEDHLVGIFSERDYARKIILHGKTSKETLVKEIMTSRVITVDSKQDIERCMSLMTENHIRHLPVVENDEIIGMISIGDVVKEIIDNKQSLIEDLTNYIVGSR